MSLRLRLTLWSTLVIAVMALAGGGLFLYAFDARVDAAVDAGLRARTRALAAAIPVVGGTIQPPGPRASGVLPPTEGLVQVLDGTGRVVVAGPAPAARRPLLTSARLAAARRGPQAFATVVDGNLTRVATLPVSRGGRYIAVAGASMGVTRNAVATARLGVLAAVPAVIALGGLGSWLLTGVALRPVELMRRRAAEISVRDQEARLPVPATRDEIAALAMTLNDLLARLQQALARERTLMAAAGHELRTPLAMLRAELELASRPGRSRQDLARAIAAAAEDTERVIRLAEDLLLLARADGGHLALRCVPTDAAAVVAAVVDATAPRAEPARVRLRVSAHRLDPVVLDPDRLRQMAGNLVDNALRYAPPGSVVEIDVTASGPWLRLRVADRGPGFPPDFLPHAFQPFRRADPARSRSGGGSGLGLAIVRSLARAHGGDATAANRMGGGAVVEVRLPVSASTCHAPTL